MVHSATEELRNCLRRIAALLENGEPVRAATIVNEMNELFPRLPDAMPPNELAEAQSLLERCVQLEQGLRKNVLGALQRIAATRKSRVYRWYGRKP
jgi:hypothetical protein